MIGFSGITSANKVTPNRAAAPVQFQGEHPEKKKEYIIELKFRSDGEAIQKQVEEWVKEENITGFDFINAVTKNQWMIAASKDALKAFKEKFDDVLAGVYVNGRVGPY